MGASKEAFVAIRKIYAEDSNEQSACRCFQSGLPDGIFSNQKYQYWYILEGLGMENFGICYGHVEYLTTIWIYYI
jgi:hypothetical protein